MSFLWAKDLKNGYMYYVIFVSQGYLVHFVPYLLNKVVLVPLAWEDGIMLIQ